MDGPAVSFPFLLWISVNQIFFYQSCLSLLLPVPPSEDFPENLQGSWALLLIIFSVQNRSRPYKAGHAHWNCSLLS